MENCAAHTGCPVVVSQIDVLHNQRSGLFLQKIANLGREGSWLTDWCIRKLRNIPSRNAIHYHPRIHSTTLASHDHHAGPEERCVTLANP